MREAADRTVTDRRVPLLVKIAPDLADEDVDAVADLALELGLDGIIATNTTIARDGLGLTSDPRWSRRPAACPAHPLKARSLEVLRRLYARVGDRITLVGVGGIENAEDAWQRILAGATLVQGYSAFIYEGPFWGRAIHKGLAARLRASPYATLADAVGAEHKKADRMTLEPFGARLRRAMDERGPLCVGIDPHASLLADWGLNDDVAGLERFTPHGRGGAGRPGRRPQAAVRVLRALRLARHRRAGEGRRRGARGRRAGPDGRQARRHRLDHGRVRRDLPRKDSPLFSDALTVSPVPRLRLAASRPSTWPARAAPACSCWP